MKKSLLTGLLVALGSVQVVANQIELSISDELIDARFTTEYASDFSGRVELMHSSFDEIDSSQLSYNFFTRDKVNQFDVLLGARAYWLDAEDDDGFGLALGVGAAIELLAKLFASVEIYYSPDIITGGDFENTFEVDARLSYQLLENGSFHVGFRKLEVETDRFDIDIYDDVYFGVRFAF